MRHTPLGALALLGFSLLGHAQASERGCTADFGHRDGLTGYAETREQRLPTASENIVNPGPNGSIRVHGWSNSDVLVKACIQTSAESESEARSIATQVIIAKAAGDIHADGPKSEEHRQWNVSYEIWMPVTSNLNLTAFNGSITVEGVRGHMKLRTLNGSVKLSDVGGDVDGETTNGSVTADLVGAGWNGSGLHLATTNGGVNLNLPENFSARVETSTVNGSLRTDFPVTISGEIKKSASFVLGAGGPTIEVTTVNGSVHIARRS